MGHRSAFRPAARTRGGRRPRRSRTGFPVEFPAELPPGPAVTTPRRPSAPTRPVPGPRRRRRPPAARQRAPARRARPRAPRRPCLHAGSARSGLASGHSAQASPASSRLPQGRSEHRRFSSDPRPSRKIESPTTARAARNTPRTSVTVSASYPPGPSPRPAQRPALVPPEEGSAPVPLRARPSAPRGLRRARPALPLPDRREAPPRLAFDRSSRSDCRPPGPRPASQPARRLRPALPDSALVFRHRGRRPRPRGPPRRRRGRPAFPETPLPAPPKDEKTALNS